MPAARRTRRTKPNKGKGRQESKSAPVEPRNRATVYSIPDSPTEDEFERMSQVDESEVEIFVPMEGYVQNDTSKREPGSGTGSDTESNDSDARLDSESEAGSILLFEGDGITARRRTVVIRPGDSAVLASDYDETANVWIGIVTDLRTVSFDDDSGKADVWAKIQWCWSGPDLAELIKSFKASDFAPYERATSDYATIEHARTLRAVKYLYEWDEGSLDPPELEAGTLFVRSILAWSKKLVDPRPGFAMCMAGRCPKDGYNPFPAKRAHATDMVMHFCPRLSCRRWYHQQCLDAWDEVDPTPPYLADRGVRLLANDPDNEQDCALLAYHAETQMTGAHDEDEPPAPLPLDAVLAEMSRPNILSHLPPALVQIAQCPIVRRPGTAVDGWYPAGNVKEVVIARRLVYAALEQAFKDDEMSALTPYELCEHVGTSFRYATPYGPYWERRQKELENETWMNTPPVVCPVCKGAI
ncbi:hypothetical protein DAEQUDRAFT_567256 [Daedalea quercina L-15889]|uniref:BAH domain-containing protein n=1 Tax=Daedalea quercina L-15889 TaxID=1314783 RepID=A0A165LXY6_9APHY|nr:hypothetical protein DAEQUDRAFT_567256 [Daedalea quercina L-15889]